MKEAIMSKLDAIEEKASHTFAPLMTQKLQSKIVKIPRGKMLGTMQPYSIKYENEQNMMQPHYRIDGKNFKLYTNDADADLAGTREIRDL